MKLLDTGLNVDAEEDVPWREVGAEGGGEGGGGGEAGAGGGGGASQRRREKEQVRGFDASAAAAVVALLQEIGLNKYARIFLKQEVGIGVSAWHFVLCTLYLVLGTKYSLLTAHYSLLTTHYLLRTTYYLQVDLDSLLQFGDQDLKDIGVVAIGAQTDSDVHMYMCMAIGDTCM